MPSSKSFGRRAPVEPTFMPAIRKNYAPVRSVHREPVPLADTSAEPGSEALAIEQEIEEWNDAHTFRRPSIREPWRSTTIAASIGFFATGWLLPADVATVVQLVLGGLTAVSLWAGWRARADSR